MSVHKCHPAKAVMPLLAQVASNYIYQEICSPEMSLSDASILGTAPEEDNYKDTSPCVSYESNELVIIPPKINSSDFAYYKLRVFM